MGYDTFIAGIRNIAEKARSKDSDILMHYGVKRRSGRYPYGSGKDPYQHSGDFLSRIEELEKSGLSEKEIADSMELKVSQLRIQKSLAVAERRTLQVDTAKGLANKGLGPTAIGKQMGISESTVRSLLDEGSEVRMNQAKATADLLREQIDKKGMIDVGKGVERELGISREKLDQALYILEMEGYPTYKGGIPQPTNPGQQSNRKVVCPPGTQHKEIYEYDKVHSLRDYTSNDDGETFYNVMRPPVSLSSKRISINYAEDGGVNKDGVIELRRGVGDISLGESRYAQVRILVDGTHYLKGMAVYADDLPDGVDVRFNTNKKKGTPMCGEDKHNTVLKHIKTEDPDNPFGAVIKKQNEYTDADGNVKQGVINIKSMEGDWNDWSNKVPSQFLGKQDKSLIERQLGITKTEKKMEYDEICSLTNPTVKKVLLESFANDCDSAAVHLKAAALPRQRYQVILPLTTVKEGEVYAPNFKDGEKIALIRFPHGGIFEIPILTVNNKNVEGQKIMGKNPKDAVGISAKVAEQLSGADFDGDTVLAIPTHNGSGVKITNKHPLEELVGFDPKMEYPARPGMKVMKDTQKQMGVISNLITDMTLKGATDGEIARAVKHSMVVIDAEKHKLDYKKSEADNNIAALKKRYQGEIDPITGRYHEGAGTLLSRSKSEKQVLKVKGSPKINQKGKPWYDESQPEGAYIYNRVREEYVDKNGKVQIRTQKSTKMAEAKDAMELVSATRNPKELVYADYANYMKALANQARKEMVYTGKIEYSPKAKAIYSKEVDQLEKKLTISEMNAPRERQALSIANARIKAIVKDNEISKEDLKKLRQREVTAAREKVGAHRVTIDITDKEWEAIQAGAISENKLKKILTRADLDSVRERATPRQNKGISEAKEAQIRSLSSQGYTNSQIAARLGISASTVSKHL